VHTKCLLRLEGHVAEGAEVVTALIVFDKMGSQSLSGVASVVTVRAVHVLDSCRYTVYTRYCRYSVHTILRERESTQDILY